VVVKKRKQTKQTGKVNSQHLLKQTTLQAAGKRATKEQRKSNERATKEQQTSNKRATKERRKSDEQATKRTLRPEHQQRCRAALSRILEHS
jgi:hypothetical protein